MKKESKKVTDIIKSFEDAQKMTKRPDVPEFSDAPEDMRDYFKAHYKISVIAEALNEGWKPDWNDHDQRKWFPYFWLSSAGFSFGAARYLSATADAGVASRLCFKTDELATYAGKQFVEIWNDIILK